MYDSDTRTYSYTQKRWRTVESVHTNTIPASQKRIQEEWIVWDRGRNTMHRYRMRNVRTTCALKIRGCISVWFRILHTFLCLSEGGWIVLCKPCSTVDIHVLLGCSEQRQQGFARTRHKNMRLKIRRVCHSCRMTDGPYRRTFYEVLNDDVTVLTPTFYRQLSCLLSFLTVNWFTHTEDQNVICPHASFWVVKHFCTGSTSKANVWRQSPSTTTHAHADDIRADVKLHQQLTTSRS